MAPQQQSKSSESSSRRRWSSLVSNKKNKNTKTRRSKRSNKEDASSSSTTTSLSLSDHRLPPLAIWISHIIPFLDRNSQDSLVQVHKEVWYARKSALANTTTSWPIGRIVSRYVSASRGHNHGKVQSVAFVGSPLLAEQLLVSNGKPHILQVDKLKGPIKGDDNNISIKHPQVGEAIVAISPSPVDPTLVATIGDRDGSIQLWKQQLQPDAGDGHTGGWSLVKTWNARPNNNLTQKRLVWAPTGDRIATWGLEGSLRVVSSLGLEQETEETGSTTTTVARTQWFNQLSVGGCLQSVAFTPNGQSLLFGWNNEYVHQWDFLEDDNNLNNRRRRRHNGNNNNNGDDPYYRDDHYRILPQLRQDEIAYWNEGGGAFISGLTFTPNGQSLLVGCQVALLKIWTVVENNIQQQQDNNTTKTTYEYVFSRQIKFGSTFDIFRNQWSPYNLTCLPVPGRRDGDSDCDCDCRYVACTNFKGPQIRIVDLITNKVVRTWRAAALAVGRVESLSFSHDEKVLVSGINKTINLWDVSDLHQVQSSSRASIPFLKEEEEEKQDDGSSVNQSNNNTRVSMDVVQSDH